MIPAVVAKFELVSLPAQGDSCELMSQTDSKNWLPAHEPPDVVHRVSTRLGVTGAVRQEHAVGLKREDILRRSLRRDHRHLAAFAAQLAQNVLLDPVIVSH